MVQVTFDLNDTDDPPFLAQKMYRYYQYDCLETASFILRKCLDSPVMKTIFPDLTNEKVDKISRILRVEILARFCQSTENLAVLAISFNRSYANEKQEILGLYDKLVNYGLGEIGDFHENLLSRSPNYFAKIAGYPSPDLQTSTTRTAFLDSCANLKEKLMEISEYYRQLRLLYNWLLA